MDYWEELSSSPYEEDSVDMDMLYAQVERNQPEYDMDRISQLAKLREKIELLPRSYREPVLMTCEDYPDGVICMELGISKSELSQRRLRAVRLLRLLLDPRCPGDVSEGKLLLADAIMHGLPEESFSVVINAPTRGQTPREGSTVGDYTKRICGGADCYDWRRA